MSSVDLPESFFAIKFACLLTVHPETTQHHHLDKKFKMRKRSHRQRAAASSSHRTDDKNSNSMSLEYSMTFRRRKVLLYCKETMQRRMSFCPLFSCTRVDHHEWSCLLKRDFMTLLFPLSDRIVDTLSLLSSWLFESCLKRDHHNDNDRSKSIMISDEPVWWTSVINLCDNYHKLPSCFWWTCLSSFQPFYLWSYFWSCSFSVWFFVVIFILVLPCLTDVHW